ncbi:MAG TPA: SurA N-terminal domain-containing protein [Hyphomicrobiaceae bacterium]|nr:SurA N-terminal domain-containing protein [Hyphomicrobiaceae bacterium]
MLDALRRGAVNIFAKILLGLLIVSFAIWGIADVFRGFGMGSLARVGSTEIPVSEFQRSYAITLDNYARQMGRRPTPEEARQMGIDRLVLAELIGAAAIDAHARELGLALSDRAIVTAIENDPAFRGMDGRFSKEVLDNVLRRSGLSERGFIALKRQDQIRDQLTGAMVGAVPVPDTLVNLLHQYREETRKVEHFTIDTAKVQAPGEPTEAQLKETYERQQQRFRTPERRQLAVLALTMETVKKRVTVTEEAVKAAYEADRERYNIPEKRRIQQISFKDASAAETAAKAVAEGKSFLDVAKEAGASASDIELGLLTKDQMLDPAIAQAAFALPKDQVSSPVKGRFSTVLLRVTEIVPGKKRTFEEVKEEIRDMLASEHAREEIRKLYDQVEDQRAGGKPLKEIAAELGIEFVSVAAIDRSGMSPEGKPVLLPGDTQNLLQAAFEGEVGAEIEPVELADGGIAWVDVIAVTPERLKPFEEVKAEVKEVWRETEFAKGVAQLADKFVTRANSGEPMIKLAQEAGGTFDISLPFNRSGARSGLPTAAVNRAFALAPNAAAHAETLDRKSRIVLKVTEINTPPPPTEEQAKALRVDIARQMQTDVMAEYLAAVQARFGVSVNEAVYRNAVGQEQP